MSDGECELTDERWVELLSTERLYRGFGMARLLSFCCGSIDMIPQ